MMAKYLTCLLLLSLIASWHGMSALKNRQSHKLSLGVVLDLSSYSGRAQKIAIRIAVENFYAHLSYRPFIFFKDSGGDPVQAFHSSKTLIENYHVRAIIGVGTWKETILVAEICNKSGVPLISLARDSPAWASQKWPFLINSVRNQDAQFKAVTAIVQSWQWRKLVIIYEDSGPAVTPVTIPYLLTVLKAAGSEISEFLPLPSLFSNHTISAKLERLKHGESRVFIVHTSINLAMSVFTVAKSLGMMEKNFVWITTDEISNSVDTLSALMISSMQGVLGVKSYFSCEGRRCEDFKSKFKGIVGLQYSDKPLGNWCHLITYALEAYDAMWALALAMKVNTKTKQLLDRLLQSNFEGLTGSFKFRNAMLAPSCVFQIINIVGKSYREVGYWTEGIGFSEYMGGCNYSNSMQALGEVFWPGAPWLVPRGWDVATSAKPLRIGVPTGGTFKEFVNVRNGTNGGDPIVGGFSIDVFKATVALLPYDLQYRFVPFYGPYDTLVQQVKLKNFDAAVGDTSIVANRCDYAEFSQPYSASGLQMLIHVNSRRMDRTWLFKKPFTSMMWVATGVVNVYNGLVVWLIERNHNPRLRGTLWNQIGTMLSLAFTTLFSLQGAKLHSNLSRMAMVVWLFVALVITQSFTANLTTLLTTERLDPPPVNVETLKKNNAKVGCSGNSFVVNYLEVVLGFQRRNIKKVFIEEDYPRLLRSGEIAAAFLEIPYIQLLLAKTCGGFTTSGPIHNVGGFGFAFPKGSPYLPDISEAILKVSESGTLPNLENSLLSSNNCTASEPKDSGTNSLGIGSFLGLFVITVVTSTVALFLFIFHHIFKKKSKLLAIKEQQSRCWEAERLDLLVDRQDQHHPCEDESSLFASEMKNQQAWNNPPTLRLSTNQAFM